MPNGRGRGRGLFWRRFAPWGFGFCGLGGYPAYRYPYFWGGRGNPVPFCRNSPWFPRRWWARPNYCSEGRGGVSAAEGARLLKNEARLLEDQLEQIRTRIVDLENVQP